MGDNDVAEAVVEAAWAALTTQQQEEADLKGLVLGNDKLRKCLQVYRKVVEDLELADAAATIEDSTSDSATSTASPRAPDHMCDRLRDKLSSSEFLHQLVSNVGEKSLDSSVVRGHGDQEKGLWLFVSGDTVMPKEERDELGTNEGYVVITQQDIVDGVACFVARSIASLPQSKTMSPDKLQQAIIVAFSELQKTGKLQSLWSCAHLLYAATSWGCTALGLYKNPVIRRAAWLAVYTSSSIVLRLFT